MQQQPKNGLAGVGGGQNPPQKRSQMFFRRGGSTTQPASFRNNNVSKIEHLAPINIGNKFAIVRQCIYRIQQIEYCAPMNIDD